MKSIKDRLAYLERNLEMDNKTEMLRSANEVKDQAKNLALLSLLTEIYEKLGGSSEAILEEYYRRVDIWHSVKLNDLEDSSPDLAARLDRRELSAVSVFEYYTPLFRPSANGPEATENSAIRGTVWGFNRRSPPYWPGRRIEHAVPVKEKSGITRCARPAALIPFFPRPPLCARF